MLEDVLSEEKSDLSEVAHVQNVTGPLKIPIRKQQVTDPLVDSEADAMGCLENPDEEEKEVNGDNETPDQ